MRTPRKIYILHRSVAVSNLTFMHGFMHRGRFGLAWSLQHEPSSRPRLVSASFSTHHDSTMARAANFTHSSGIALILYLLHNIILCNYKKRRKKSRDWRLLYGKFTIKFSLKLRKIFALKVPAIFVVFEIESETISACRKGGGACLKKFAWPNSDLA